MFDDYIHAQLNFFTHCRLRDALASHAHDGTEAHHAIDQALPDIENSAAAAAIKSVVAKQYGNTVPIDTAIEVMLRLLETGKLS